MRVPLRVGSWRCFGELCRDVNPNVPPTGLQGSQENVSVTMPTDKRLTTGRQVFRVKARLIKAQPQCAGQKSGGNLCELCEESGFLFSARLKYVKRTMHSVPRIRVLWQVHHVNS